MFSWCRANAYNLLQSFDPTSWFEPAAVVVGRSVFRPPLYRLCLIGHHGESWCGRAVWTLVAPHALSSTGFRRCACVGGTTHYENTPIQIYWNFHHRKTEKFQIKKFDIFLISAQNIDRGYSLEPPRRGGSNEYPQSMFLSRNKKNNVYPCKPQFYYIKVGFKGVKII